MIVNRNNTIRKFKLIIRQAHTQKDKKMTLTYY